MSIKTKERLSEDVYKMLKNYKLDNIKYIEFEDDDDDIIKEHNDLDKPANNDKMK